MSVPLPPPEPQVPSVAHQVGSAVVGFPKYIFEWTVGLVIAILSDLHVTTLALTGVAVGVAASSILWGVAAFFIVYATSRVINNHATATIAGANIIHAGLSDIANS